MKSLISISATLERVLIERRKAQVPYIAEHIDFILSEAKFRA
jgi:hypothetical protein